MKITDKHVLFWSGPFSNWANIPGGIIYKDNSFSDALTFETSEHLFMFFKAMYFGDKETAFKISKSKSPKEAKRLGRLVKNFNEEEWEKVREEKMELAILFKTIYWPFFREELTSSKYEGKTFVEASPYDKIWGIGMEENDTNADDETKWKGLNLLGKSLTYIRDILKINKD